LLQRSHFLISPAYHRLHHDRNHDTRYAVVNGWSNAICDRIGFWRGLERLIQALTAAQPRRSDKEWMSRFVRHKQATERS
jgi:ubiquitin-conjugating enzyme E2 variant